MICPYCSSYNLSVIDKRNNEDSNSIRRRRSCNNCGKRFTTYERIEKVLLNVRKRDGSIEEFDREKIKRGILKAVKKRNIEDNKIEEIVNNIEQTLLMHDEQTITSTEIGKLVLVELNKIDKLGALLFAAVYKDFQSLEDVQKELKRLESKK